MSRKLDRLTTALSALLLLGVLLACKKKPSPVSSGSAVAASPAAPAAPSPAVAAPAEATPEPAAATAKLGEVKRYTDKEKAQSGAVRVLQDGVKVFNEADDKTAEVATLNKDLLVFRLASIPDWELVEFPSGVGKVSPGWVLSTFIDAKADSQVERSAVAAQSKQAAVVGSSAAKPLASAANPAAASSAKVAADKAAAEKALASKAATDKAAADKAAADKAAADKAAAEKTAAADKAAADKVAADKAAVRAARLAERAAKRAQAAAEKAAAAK